MALEVINFILDILKRRNDYDNFNNSNMFFNIWF